MTSLADSWAFHSPRRDPPPTLVLVGAEDQPAIHAIAERLCDNIPHAQKVVIPDAGHHPTPEQPGLFNQLVMQFVGRIDPV